MTENPFKCSCVPKFFAYALRESVINPPIKEVCKCLMCIIVSDHALLYVLAVCVRYHLFECTMHHLFYANGSIYKCGEILCILHVMEVDVNVR